MNPFRKITLKLYNLLIYNVKSFRKTVKDLLNRTIDEFERLRYNNIYCVNQLSSYPLVTS